jgi:hypothetical protein
MRRVRARKDRFYSKERKKGRALEITKEAIGQLKRHREKDHSEKSRKQPEVPTLVEGVGAMSEYR